MANPPGDKRRVGDCHRGSFDFVRPRLRLVCGIVTAGHDGEGSGHPCAGERGQGRAAGFFKFGLLFPCIVRSGLRK